LTGAGRIVWRAAIVVAAATHGSSSHRRLCEV
jgi:hypothetical protein